MGSKESNIGIEDKLLVKSIGKRAKTLVYTLFHFGDKNPPRYLQTEEAYWPLKILLPLCKPISYTGYCGFTIN